MKISYAITFCNEYKELRALLTVLLANIDPEDEIVVLTDTTKALSEEVYNLKKEYETVDIRSGEFTGDFGAWKNKLNTYCTGEYIFQIDADELLEPKFLKEVKKIIKANPVDVFAVPRENRVDGILREDMMKWGWWEGPEGINWPDYQYRIYRNSETIKWSGKVHEKITGYTSLVAIPASIDKNYHRRLLHYKSIDKQRMQNELYSNLIREAR